MNPDGILIRTKFGKKPKPVSHPCYAKLQTLHAATARLPAPAKDPHLCLPDGIGSDGVSAIKWDDKNTFSVKKNSLNCLERYLENQRYGVWFDAKPIGTT